MSVLGALPASASIAEALSWSLSLSAEDRSAATRQAERDLCTRLPLCRAIVLGALLAQIYTDPECSRQAIFSEVSISSFSPSFPFLRAPYSLCETDSLELSSGLFTASEPPHRAIRLCRWWRLSCSSLMTLAPP